jgi:ATP/maltotriose-dependent transcriptional regulator MalT
MRLPTALRWSRCYHDGLRHYHEGDHALAERELREAVRTAEHIRPHDDRLGCSLYALARLRQLHGDLEGAQRLYRRALEAETGALGPDHPFTRDIAHAYAGLLRQRAQAAAMRRRDGRRAVGREI